MNFFLQIQVAFRRIVMRNCNYNPKEAKNQLESTVLAEKKTQYNKKQLILNIYEKINFLHRLLVSMHKMKIEEMCFNPAVQCLFKKFSFFYSALLSENLKINNFLNAKFLCSTSSRRSIQSHSKIVKQ